jgi:actin-like ATPase involved in cell morphogenesis
VDSGYRLAVDLGTCHTVAVVRRGGEAPRALLFDGSPLLPSGVFAGPGGALQVGRDAERMSTSDPARFEPFPKRRVDEGTVLLGDAEVGVVDLFTALLRRVAEEARQAGVAPPGATVLTCPADWGPRRRAALLAAARAAGLAPPSGDVPLVDEPIAAATYCERVLGQQVAPGRCLAVFDFGGGTLDVTVVRRDPDGLRVLAVGGLDDLGGVDIDAALVGHLGQLIGLHAPGVWGRLESPTSTGELRDRRTFWTEVRAAKEMLSRTAAAPVPVPGREEALHLTREELERVAGPLVDRAVDETRRVLQRAGVDRAQLAGILLVGGSSRIPLVASRLHTRFGVAPTVPEQPELPVAYGALLTPAPPMPAPPVSAPPVSPAAPPPPGYPPPSFQPPPPVAAPVAVKPRRRSRIPVFALVVLLLAGCGFAYRGAARAITRAVDSLTGISIPDVTGGDGGSTAPALTAAGDAVSLGDGAAAATSDGSTVYYAAVGSGKTTVTALSGDGKPAWQAIVPVEPTDVRLSAVGGLLVLDGRASATDGGKSVRAVVDLASHALRWKALWESRYDVTFAGTDVIVESQQQKVAVERISLLTGKTVWSRPVSTDWGNFTTRAVGVPLAWPAGSTATGKAGAATQPDNSLTSGTWPFRESLAVDTTTVVAFDASSDASGGKATVFNAADGRPKATGAVPLDDELGQWTVFDGALIGKVTDAASPGRAKVAAYRLDKLGKAWEMPFPAGSRVQHIRPCGPHLVCVYTERSGTSDQVLTPIDMTTGKAAWPARSAGFGFHPRWYVLGGRLVYGDGTFGPVNKAVVLNPVDGKQERTIGGGDVGSLVVAADGPRAVLRTVHVALPSGHTNLALSVVDVLTGAASPAVDVGAEAPKEVGLVGGVLTVITSANELRAWRVPGGADK